MLKSSKVFRDIEKFNKDLNSWDYGILIDGKKYTDVKDVIWKKYKTIPIDDVEKYHVGVCWDFVNYESKWFKDHNIAFNTYYVTIDDNSMCPTHTFLIFKFNTKYYYFESSWFSYQGIQQFDYEKDAIRTVCSRHNKAFNKGNHKSYVFRYNTDGMDNRLSASEFMERILKYGEDIILI